MTPAVGSFSAELVDPELELPRRSVAQGMALVQHPLRAHLELRVPPGSQVEAEPPERLGDLVRRGWLDELPVGIITAMFQVGDSRGIAFIVEE